MPKDISSISQRRRDQLINLQIARFQLSSHQSNDVARREVSQSHGAENVTIPEEAQSPVDIFAQCQQLQHRQAVNSDGCEERQQQSANTDFTATSSDIPTCGIINAVEFNQCESIESVSSGEFMHERSNSSSTFEKSDSDTLDNDLAANFQALRDDVLECKKDNLRNSLSAWVSKYNIRHNTVNCLLQLLKMHGLDELPNDVRTLMQMPRNTGADILSHETGRYKYFDLNAVFSREIRKYFINIPDVIEVNINVDGLPLAKSSKSQFWPILVLIKAEFPTTPFLAGIYHGDSKPKNVNTFLEPFVTDMARILERGIVIDFKIVRVKIKAICCDAPARAFIASVKGHNGYYGCTKCTQKGHQICNRVTFPRVDCALRSDESFRLKQQPQHHLGNSVLETLGLGMVSQITLDYMHLTCLGVMKRLILFWTRGTRNIKFSDVVVDEASGRLLSMKEHIPKEFQRKPRSLNDCDRWKATEFRQCLLYTGPVVLIGVGIPEKFLVHFISLSVAIRILSNRQTCINEKARDYAQSLLLWFVSNYGSLYGEHYISYNVHNLVHLTNEVKKFGSLDEFSCFPFENYLQLLKNKISKSGKPLEEIINRTNEAELLPHNRNRAIKKYPVVHCTSRGEITHLEFQGFIISTKKPDNCCMIKDKSAIVVHEIMKENNGIYILAKRLENNGSLYTKPCNSKLLGIFVAFIESSETHSEFSKLPVSEIEQKCMKLTYSKKDRTFVIIPMLHVDH